MFNNQHLFQHIDRQPNVILVVIESNGDKAQWFMKLCSLEVYVVQGQTYLEARLYERGDSPEPLRVITYVNPRKWEMVAQPDPETLA